MADLQSLVKAIRELIFSAEKQAAFNKDQAGYLATCGAADATPAQVHEAVGVLAQELAPDLGTRLTAAVTQAAQSGGFGTGSAGATVATGGGVVSTSAGAGGAHAVVAEPQVAAIRAIEQITQVTNNYTQVTRIDDRDTEIETTNNNNIRAGGNVNIDQRGPNVASGDGAAAVTDANVGVLNTGTNTGVIVGDDNNAPVVTGTNTGVVADGDVRNVNQGQGVINDNDGSIVRGDQTTGFGSGATVGAGGALAGDNSDINIAGRGGTILGAGDNSPTNIGGVQVAGGGSLVGGDQVTAGPGSQVATGGGQNIDADRSTVATGGGQANTNQVGTEGGVAQGVATNQANVGGFGTGADGEVEDISIQQAIEQSNQDYDPSEPEPQSYVNIAEQAQELAPTEAASYVPQATEESYEPVEMDEHDL